MIFTETPLKGAFVIEINKIGDERGFFGRSWCKKEMQEAGLNSEIAQINTSLSRQKGTLRGLHFQIAPYQESKMIRCTKGAIFDMIVDIRPESSSFLQWYGVELTESNHKALYSPEGFAQGFITLVDDTEITYFTNEFYAPGKDRGLRYNDSQVGIKLPIDPVVIADKDMSWPDFTLDMLT
ncbi:dTDP-4-dehydrorhamnose 3,5-epimerase [Desulfuromusa kysingii]|uniref:dTDP-4-dehydrorhamnose 3,5-epimerase n=1 Tax=Desulfuromusa kysingii TaxID=37625 RepID=A0A1H4BA09_9BACT|nr:dTDP-4-dehydrorhamnose 3,5-epimerase [Desulfuromusa kysingii]SEA44808.1 dTDP-4-dehydrorhamnose 3,5-epimerase [Desulfuromusa kysingii]